MKGKEFQGTMVGDLTGRNKLNGGTVMDIVHTRERILKGIIVVSSLMAVLFLAVCKKGMHEDEYYTYLLANHEGNGLAVEYENGIKLNSSECFDQFFYADGFSIKNIWNNQKNDVHPPLYYLIFHIFSLLTHHYGGMKSGIILNAFFHICNIMVLYSILKRILHRIDMSLLGCGLYAMLPAVLGNVIFIRMYALMSLFVLLLVLCMLEGMQDCTNRRTYIFLGIVSIAGILTHYYFIIYLFYSCVIYGGRLLVSRMWKHLVGFIMVMGGAVGISYIIFPVMISHIFLGYRGEQSFDNLLHSQWGASLKFYMQKLDNIFGGLMLAVIAISCICLLKNAGRLNHKKKENIYILMIILVPGILYFLTITKIAVLMDERYISPIFGISVILLIWGIEKLVDMISASKGTATAIAICIVGLILGNSWKSYTWDGLHLEAEAYLDIANQYGQNNECIDIYNTSWKSISALQQLAKYQAVSFIPSGSLGLLDSEYIKEYDHLVVYVDSDLGEEQINNILETLLEKNSKLQSYNLLYQYGYQTAYYLE